MIAHHFTTQRTARYYTIGEPGPQARDVWFVCHGYGQLAAEFMAEFEPLAAPDRLIVAPEALSRFYPGDANGRHGRDARIAASWMTREDRLSEIDDYVAYLDGLAEQVLSACPDSARLRVLGFSQGASTACRWVARGKRKPAELIVWAGEMTFDLDDAPLAERLQGVGVHLVGGLRDRVVPSAIIDKQRDRLRRAGVDATVHHFDGGHRLDRQILADLADGPIAQRT